MKKKFKVVVVMISAFALLFSLASCGGNSNANKEYTAEDPLVLRLAHVENTEAIMHKAAEKFEKYVEEESDGVIQVELYPNAELGGEAEVVEQILSDQVQITMASPVVLDTYDIRLAFLDLPFIWDSFESMDQAMRNELGDLFQSWAAESDFYMMGYQFDGAKGISNSKHQIKNVDDLKGLKIRVTESDLLINEMKALGANPTPLAFNDIYTGLQQGTIDGQLQSPMLTYVNKFYEVQDYYSNLEITQTNACIITHKSFMDSIPEELMSIIQEGSDTYLMDWQRENAVKASTEYLDKMEDAGVDVYRKLTDEQFNEFVKAVQPVYDHYSEVVGQDVMDDFLEKARMYQ